MSIVFWALPLLYKAGMGNFSTLAIFALADGRTFMLAEGLDILHISAIALILVFLVGRIVKRKQSGFAKSAPVWGTSTHAAARFFESKHIPPLKPCPHCARQLPLPAIICEQCDYNFLAARPGRGQKLLPSPQPVIHEPSDQSSVSGGI
jgi:hypothetical protein